ncbi:MAG TPA: shikimate kinase [Candidatus Coproplasma avicola]|uniref:Shikimate kinase n=1 Tax=Candidatus Coproplasma avicola TaxID=2840744 RepID=A0A9D1E585_9FIRM|nr:shikimate kinase [Candidatus Coproplasma avicola]
MKNIVLCGMMGSGKTTVARALNAIYNLNWVDTDDQIVGQYGAINDIFARLGEEGFRDIESAVTKRVAQSCANSVISLGGGCVLRKINVEELKKTGVIFYLRTSPETVIKRVKGDTTRPLLHGDLEERVRTISANRASVYEGAADYIIDTDDKSPECIAELIMERMQK